MTPDSVRSHKNRSSGDEQLDDGIVDTLVSALQLMILATFRHDHRRNISAIPPKANCVISDRIPPNIGSPSANSKARMGFTRAGYQASRVRCRRRHLRARVAGVVDPLRRLAAKDIRFRATISRPATSYCSQLPRT